MEARVPCILKSRSLKHRIVQLLPLDESRELVSRWFVTTSLGVLTCAVLCVVVREVLPYWDVLCREAGEVSHYLSLLP